MATHHTSQARWLVPRLHLVKPPSRLKADEPNCIATREILSMVGDKWSVLVIVGLGEGTRRFSDLKRAIEGISQRMLTLTLRGLERDGLVVREVYPTVPPRVDYTLTPLGRNLLEPVSQLAMWAMKNQQQIQAARDAYERASRATKR